ncbi:unnamed protein product [Discula destructiva]
MATASVTRQEAIPPQPKSILRGHKAQVHAAAFLRSNERLLTGDADGFVVAWDLTIMRPRAVWQAHQNAILGIAGWGPDKVITHGRDNRLIVWRLSAQDEAAMSTTLPLDPAPTPRPKPWMLHLLEVNTMNFCSFAHSPASAPTHALDSFTLPQSDFLIAVPNTLVSEAIDIYHLPSQNRIHVVKVGGDHGMAMALAAVWLNGILTLLVGYEDGMAIVAQLEYDGSWRVIYRNQCHKQPVLSLDVAPSHDFFLTSSADASIAKHPLPTRQAQALGLVENSTETIAATDNCGCQPVPGGGKQEMTPGNGKSVSLLSAALAPQSPAASPQAAQQRQVETQPLKIVDTKHSGQQSLRIRSDGRIFATAGWDAKVRVYSAKTMREVAVLKWHPVGCFAVAFANITAADSSHGSVKSAANEHGDKGPVEETSLVPKVLDMTVKDRRIAQAKSAHWLAAGSKDGKVSLWDVF